MKCSPNALDRAEFARTVHYINAEPGTSIEDVIKPDFWSHVSHKLRPHDRIEVMAKDGSYFAELLVLSCAKLWAKMFVLRHVPIGAEVTDLKPVETNGDYEVKWAGPAKWRVIRLKDKAMLTEGHATKKEAEEWLDKHLTELAA